MYLFMSYVMIIAQDYFSKRNSIDLSKNAIDGVAVFPVFQNEMNSILDDYITKALYHLENKYKILSRTEREIFKDHKPIMEDNKKR